MYAVSYKHVEKDEWKRKGESRTAKMSDIDQEALVNVVKACSKIQGIQYVILWCDQIIATRLKGEGKNSLGWYNAGLLPYACLPVLKLSSYISDEVLESRVWLKAERSLGRLGSGTVEVHDAIYGIPGHAIVQRDLERVIRSIAGMILSGYWPKDMGYWKDDYLQMKKWAVSVLVNMKAVSTLPIFDEIKGVDNLEILSIMNEFAHVPKGLQCAEKPMHTDDRLFFLKATAWNMYVQDIWNCDQKTVSHYMGSFCMFTSFTWWANESMTAIFGYLRGMEMGTAVLAVEDGRGYLLHRKAFDPILYSHADKHPSNKALGVLEDVKNLFSIELNLSQKWVLLYSFSNDSDAVCTDPSLRKGLEGWATRSDCLVPRIYRGLTTKLYRSAVAKDSDKSAVSKRFLQILDSWNRYIREDYENYISMRDTLAGTIWLEGYSEDKVSFGFYDYLTRYLSLGANPGERSTPQFSVRLPSRWEFVQETRRIAASSTKDVQILVDEVFGSATEVNCNEFVNLRDVACFMVHGGLTASMDGTELKSFLCRVAAHRGYWTTSNYSRAGTLQIMFASPDGNVRVAQMKTSLSEFHSIGIVRPRDRNAIFKVSVPVEDDPEQYRTHFYWKSMESSTSRHELQTLFVNSVYAVDGGQDVLLVDMSVMDTEEERSVIDVERISSCVSETERLMMQLLENVRSSNQARRRHLKGNQTEQRNNEQSDQRKQRRLQTTHRGRTGTVDEIASVPNILPEKSKERLLETYRGVCEFEDRCKAVMEEHVEAQR
ncbi:hypothetical protein FGB62_74g119 [Gracilaria domingensis]|nr:hypothetical protein FGB62_74g119 [Gracilaria domingensis]